MHISQYFHTLVHDGDAVYVDGGSDGEQIISTSPIKSGVMAVGPLETLIDGRAFLEAAALARRGAVGERHARLRGAARLDGRRRRGGRGVGRTPVGIGRPPHGRMLIVAMDERRVLRLEDGSLVEHADCTAFAPHEINDMVVDDAGHAFVSQFGYDHHAGEKLRRGGWCCGSIPTAP